MAEEKKPATPRTRSTTKDVRILEDLAKIKADIETLKNEYPAMQKSLNHISENLSGLTERIARVEVETENAHEKIDDFKRTIAWTIGVSMTACGTVVGVISFVLQYVVFK